MPRSRTHWLTGRPAKTSGSRGARQAVCCSELLYGSGLRISEAVGLNLDDFDRTERWVRVRGKGKKERQGSVWCRKSAAALDAYLEVRAAGGDSVEEVQRICFLNHRGKRLTDRGARSVIEFYARFVAGDSSIHPHTLRHAIRDASYSAMARICESDSGCSGMRAFSTTQKYTQVSLSDLDEVYDKSHPRAREMVLRRSCRRLRRFKEAGDETACPHD